MTEPLQAALDRLSPTQRKAADWQDSAALVLAGPGVGKTTVLTTRIARILNDSRNKNFRMLALTFTTKAGDEMRERVDALVPGLTDRTFIGTFHSFCAQILRQHGSHIGIKPDFGIYDQDDDRRELLREALVAAADEGADVTPDGVRWLRAIDQLRSSLVSAEKTARHFRDPAAGERAARVYAIYEAALRANNSLDFNGMILDACRLAHQVPAVAARTRQSYPYWLIGEFQDTTPAQYRLVRFFAGDDFKNVFAVADDDQIIYQWAGASYRQIQQFREHFSPDLIQLVENRRCPPAIVHAASNLIGHNSDRTPGKEPLVATLPGEGPAILLRTFGTDGEEADGIADDIAGIVTAERGEVAVLGRTRAILQPVLDALKARGHRFDRGTARPIYLPAIYLASELPRPVPSPRRPTSLHSARSGSKPHSRLAARHCTLARRGDIHRDQLPGALGFGCRSEPKRDRHELVSDSSPARAIPVKLAADCHGGDHLSDDDRGSARRRHQRRSRRQGRVGNSAQGHQGREGRAART